MVFKQTEHRYRWSLNSQKIIADVRNSQNSESWSCVWSCQTGQSPTLILTRTSSGVSLQDQYSEMVQSGWTRSSCLPESIYQSRRTRRDNCEMRNTTPDRCVHIVRECWTCPPQKVSPGTWWTSSADLFLHILRNNQQLAFICCSGYWICNVKEYWQRAYT